MTMTMITPAPDPEVPEKAKRRRFTAGYKLGIVEAADCCRAASVMAFRAGCLMAS